MLRSVLFLLAISSVAAESPAFYAAYRAGRADAERDMRNGYLAIEMSGKTAPWEDDYARAALERYKVHVKLVAGCIVDDATSGHAKGYNEISDAEIQRRFGKHTLENLQLEVISRWEAKLTK